jgi:hypothetical protein
MPGHRAVADDRMRLENERDQLDREIDKLSRAIAMTSDVPELAKQLNEKARRRTIVVDTLNNIYALVRKDLLVGLEGKVRAEFQELRSLLKSADAQELRHELQRHIAGITVDGQGQMRIEGTLAGALDAVLKVVAGARWSTEWMLPARWTVTQRVRAKELCWRGQQPEAPAQPPRS